MLGNYQKAIDDYYLALELDSKKKTIYRNMGRVLGLSNDNPESDRTVAHDVNHSHLSSSKPLDNIDGDINHYVYKQLNDLAIRNTNLSIDNPKIKINNKFSSPTQNSPSKLISHINHNKDYQFSNKVDNLFELNSNYKNRKDD